MNCDENNEMFLKLLAFLFQEQAVATQGTLAEVTLLAQAHPAMPAVQNGHWAMGVDAEAGGGFDPTQMAASISVPGAFKVKSQAAAQSPILVPVQNQQPVGSSSAPAAALTIAAVSALNMAPVPVPVDFPMAQVPAAISAAAGRALAPPAGSLTTLDPPAVCEAQVPASGSAPVPVPVTLPVPAQPAATYAASVQPAGNQSAAAESASLAPTQQNLDSKFASSTVQHEPYIEVGAIYLHTSAVSFVTIL